jgi:diguanylate cyclase (GGDEF)-like protein
VFGLLAGLAMITLLFVLGRGTTNEEMRLLTEAAALTALTVVATVFVPWERLPHWLEVTPPFVFLFVTFLGREAVGGTGAPWTQLVLVPVVWLGVYGSPGELVGGLIGVALTLATPLLVPGSTAVEWRAAAFLVAVSAIVGFSVQLFFAHLRRHTDRLARLALTDHLTGVANRRAWDAGLDAAVERARHTRRPVTVAALDIDRFKRFNDEFGHQAGDRFLKEVAARWQSELRGADLLARIGGDEFAVVFPESDAEAAAVVARRLCEDLPPGRTCSGGVAEWTGRETPFELMARADDALYAAKEAGRARVVVAGRRPVASRRRTRMDDASPPPPGA